MICPACTGTGMESTDPEDASTCLDCGGSGVKEESFDVINRLCPLCGGTGQKSERFQMYHPDADQSCSRCGGSGKEEA